jgi:hypothetical protein
MNKLKYFWCNVDYATFCELMYGGKNDTYTREKWDKFQRHTMVYICSLGEEYLARLTEAMDTFYERKHDA